MNSLFNPDNKIMIFLGKMGDCMLLSLLWFFCSLPIITFGASTTALYYTVRKNVIDDESTLSRCFFSSFRSNFKQSFCLELIFLLLAAILAADTWVTYHLGKAGVCHEMLFLVFVFLLLLLLLWSAYFYPYIARFENTTRQVLKNTSLISISNMPRSLLILVLQIIAIIATLFLPVGIFLIPACYMLVKVKICEKIFQKYIPAEESEEEPESSPETLSET